ncbi:MAG: fluoride efflux transporter CrcB [Rudaea sp.]
MTLIAFLAVGGGAFFGAGLRYALGLALNPVFPTLPLGTLAANLLGGLIMGLAMALFAQFQALPPELRLFLATGFLGGLTTFSTFSAETLTLMLRHEYLWALALISAHLIGTLSMTFLGFILVQGIARAWA